jgi:signal transduction histidine kinase
MGGVALFILLLISVLLSKIVLRPVEKAWVQQQQFVADASHELKTPLTVILANNDILMSPGHVNDTVIDQKQWVESTQAEATHMKKLVDNLLFLARSDAADAASQKIICSDVSWSDTVMDIYLQFEPVAFENGVTIDADIERDTKVNGDPTQLRQLAHILIDNAIKYAGDNGRIFVKVASKGSVVDFSVNNTGAPIPKADIGHIFERFYRADKARKQEGGYGLGLAIAKSIVEKHGGIITCKSNETDGTTFTATLPLAAAASGSRIFKRGQKVKAVKPQSEPGTVSSADSSPFSSEHVDNGPPEGVLDADYVIKEEASSEPSLVPPEMPPLSSDDSEVNTNKDDMYDFKSKK